jgi:photosystem II stability/assembly factor-like uncharacterized protein
MFLGLSHGGTSIYSSPSRSDEVWVGTREGIVVIGRIGHGKDWRITRRLLEDKHISAIVTEPESGLTFAGAFNGSVQVTGDNGKTWETRNSGLTEHDVYSLATVRRKGGTRIYLGTEPAQMFCSDDLGLSWRELPGLRSVPSVPHWKFPVPPHIAHTKHITFAPDNPDTVYACIEVGALLRSRDGGETWEQIDGVYEDVHRLAIHPRDAHRLYVVTGHGLYVSSDGGATFEQWVARPSPIAGYPDGIVIHPRKPELMFLGAADVGPGTWMKTHYAGAKISRSKDGGRTWEMLQNGLPERMQASIEALCLEDWGESASLFAATTAGDVYCSDDCGERWSRILSGLPPISKGGHYRALAVA